MFYFILQVNLLFDFTVNNFCLVIFGFIVYLPFLASKLKKMFLLLPFSKDFITNATTLVFLLNLIAIPLLTFTPAEQTQLNPIISDMITYITEMQVQFITGRRPFSQWDAFVRDVRNMGADRFVAINQAAWDRFSSN